MSRQALGITLDNSEIWARDAGGSGRVILPSITDGYPDTYNNAKLPDRRHLNYTFAQLTSLGADVNKYGSLLPWHTGIIYDQYAYVTGSDGKIYRSVAAANIAFDPTDPHNVPSKWRELSELHGIPLLKTDTEYVGFSYHPNTLAKSSSGEWSYDLSLFEGTGLVNSEIRAIHVNINAWSEVQYRAYAEMPDGTDVVLGQQAPHWISSGTRTFASGGISVIPINKGQETFTIRIEDLWVKNGSFSLGLIGASQRAI